MNAGQPECTESTKDDFEFDVSQCVISSLRPLPSFFMNTLYIVIHMYSK